MPSPLNIYKPGPTRDTIIIELPYLPYGARKIPNTHSKSILSPKGQYAYIKLKYIETKFHAYRNY